MSDEFPCQGKGINMQGSKKVRLERKAPDMCNPTPIDCVTKEFTGHNILEVTVGTTGAFGPGGHKGGITFLRLADGGGTRWEVSIECDRCDNVVTTDIPRAVEIVLSGASEVYTVIKALEFAAKALASQEAYLASVGYPGALSEFEMSQAVKWLAAPLTQDTEGMPC